MTGHRRPIADEPPRLAVDPRVVDELGVFDEKATFDSIDGAIREEARSPVARLRELSTPTRIALATLGSIVVAITIGASAHRRDLATLPIARLVLESALLAVAMGACLVVAMRPLHRPTLTRGRSALALSMSLLVGLLLALIPFPDVVAPVLGPIAPPDWSAGIPCLAFGTMVGVPVYFLARLLARGSASSAWYSAVAAGLAGDLALTIHCPVGDVAHRVSSHASLGLLFLGALGGAVAAARAFGRGRAPGI